MRPSTSLHPTTDARAGGLTATQRAYLEERLLQERGFALGSLARYGRPGDASVEGWATASGAVAPAAVARAATQAALDADFASVETTTLLEIDAALERLRDDPARFGVDEVTGEPIPFERLDLVPWARRRAAAPAPPPPGRPRRARRR
jgi:RNA polymerase-binding transcription factor DksA